MGGRLRSRRWLTGFGVLPLLALTVSLAYLWHSIVVAPRVWEAYATTVDVGALTKGYTGASKDNADRHIASLIQIAKSNTVMERASHTLRDLRSMTQPEKMLSAAKVEQTGSTDLISIAVTYEDEAEAKAGTDILAKEFIQRCRELDISGKSFMQMVDDGRATSTRVMGGRQILFFYLWPVWLCSIGIAIGCPVGRRMAGKRTPIG